MCIIAVLLTNYITAPLLLEGPSAYYGGDSRYYDEGDNEHCNHYPPPFDGARSDGFDIQTESHLVEAFGYNNVSVFCFVSLIPPFSRKRE